MGKDARSLRRAHIRELSISQTYRPPRMFTFEILTVDARQAQYKDIYNIDNIDKIYNIYNIPRTVNAT